MNQRDLGKGDINWWVDICKLKSLLGLKIPCCARVVISYSPHLITSLSFSPHSCSFSSLSFSTFLWLLLSATSFLSVSSISFVVLVPRQVVDTIISESVIMNGLVMNLNRIKVKNLNRMMYYCFFFWKYDVLIHVNYDCQFDSYN
jgi:hypothetical protein